MRITMGWSQLLQRSTGPDGKLWRGWLSDPLGWQNPWNSSTQDCSSQPLIQSQGTPSTWIHLSPASRTHRIPKPLLSSNRPSRQKAGGISYNLRWNDRVLREQISCSFHPAWKRESFPISKRFGKTSYNIIFCFGKNGIVGKCINTCSI